MEQVSQDEVFITDNLVSEEAANELIKSAQQAYDIESSASSSSNMSDYDEDEVDTQHSGFSSSVLSFEHQKKAEPFAPRALTRGCPEAKVIRVQTVFEPKSRPENYKKRPLRKTRSAEFLSSSSHRRFLPPPPAPHSKANQPFESPKTKTTVFAPRSPKNYKKKPLRKTRSAEFLSPSSHHSSQNSEHRRFLPPPPPSHSKANHSWSNHPFESPKSFSKSSDSIPPESQRTMSTFQFPSPFWTPHSSVNFGDFSAVNIINPITTDDDDETAGHNRSIRRISEGDADGTDFPFHQSMELGDVFPSVFDDTLFEPSSRSMPEMQSPSLFESSLNGQSGKVSRESSHLELAMEIDPFDDDCVRFESRPSSTNSVDWEKQIQDLQTEHAEQVNKLNREIETSNKIITSLTKQVQELMAQNEKLSLQNKKARESAREYQQRAARVDMMGHVIDSPDASPSIQKHKTVGSTMELDGGGSEHVGRKKNGKGKPKRKSSHKKKKKAKSNANGSSSSHETMAVEDHAAADGGHQSTKKRSSTKATGTTTTDGTMSISRKRSKSKRNVKQLSLSSIEADEHPLSQAKRRKSVEARSLRHSIAAIERENSARSIASKTTPNSRSSKKMSETIESLWGFDWRDPAKAEMKRDSQKKKHHSKKHLAQLKENLEASVGKLPKRTKSKRKTVMKRKAKPDAATEEVDQGAVTTTTTTTTNPLTSPIHKAKKISRRSFAAVGRLLSPRAEKRQKRTKSEQLPTSVEGDTNMVQTPAPAPEL